MLADPAEAVALLGERDEHLRLIEKIVPVRISSRREELELAGDEPHLGQAVALLNSLLHAVRAGHALSRADVRYAAEAAAAGETPRVEELWADVVLTTERGRPIKPKTIGQKRYVDAIRNHDLVFSIGPAGTGKTYLALAVGAAGLKEKQFDRLVLTRPAVEAGEKLGFLPGALEDKVDPYVRPLQDALFEFMSLERYQRLLEKRAIEVLPLAYMRGRTLSKCFVILDEGQNCTYEQTKMFLTRLGFDSKAVVTGDITQIDLPNPQASGLVIAQRVFADVDGVAFSYLTERDVIRHPLVKKIILAYERYERDRRGAPRSGDQHA